MFREADNFNQNISSWDVSSVTNMEKMFQAGESGSFDQNLGSWDISNVTNMTEMFNGQSLSDANYKATIIGWAAQTVQSNVTVDFGASILADSAGVAARTTLVNSPNNWTISDGSGTYT